MFPLRKGSVQLNSASHSVAAVVHELGHAAGLADLFNHNEPPPCVSLPHDPDTTIMDCTFNAPVGEHDIDNLGLLYERAPEQVNDFLATAETPDEISFRWTDTSYSEEFQFIAMIGGGPFPKVAQQDAETFTWDTGLQPNTNYCFVIQPANAYGILAPSSAQTCATTPPPIPIGGIIELPAVAGTALDAPEAAGGNAGLLAGIAAGGVAVVSALGGAAWWARRRHS